MVVEKIELPLNRRRAIVIQNNDIRVDLHQSLHTGIEPPGIRHSTSGVDPAGQLDQIALQSAGSGIDFIAIEGIQHERLDALCFRDFLHGLLHFRDLLLNAGDQLSGAVLHLEDFS